MSSGCTQVDQPANEGGAMCHADLEKMVASTTPHNARGVLSRLIAAKSPDGALRSLLYEFVFKIAGSDFESSGTLIDLLPPILGAVRDLPDPAPILFLVLENLRGRKAEDLRLRTLEIVRRTAFSLASILDFLHKPDMADVVLDVLNAHSSFIPDFIRSAIKIETPQAVKNVSQILPRLPVEHFTNYNSFLFLSDSENYSLRCCFLEIIEELVPVFKAQGNLDAISILTGLVAEHLCDVNFYVRARALGCISALFKKECVLKDQRNTLIEAIVGRTRDRTVLVRKKSVNMLSQILLNHPFKHKRSLAVTKTQNRENGSNAVSEASSKVRAIEEDFEQFVALMESALEAVTELLVYDLKTDVLEIVAFIKIAYLLHLDGSRSAFEKILGLAFTKDSQLIVDVFNEIMQKRSEVVYEFINNAAFDEILRRMAIDEKMLYKNFYGGHMVAESIYVLKQLRTRISEQNGMVLLTHATNILFQSQNEEALIQNIEIYRNALVVLERLKHRVSSGCELLRLIGKNVVKMRFFACGLIKHTVRLFFAVSQNPDKSCAKLLRNLCLCRSTLKILDCVGWIATNQFYLLERLEKSYKGQDLSPRSAAGFGALDTAEFENFRRSIGEDGLESIRERRRSLEQTRRLSLGRSAASKLSIKFDELTESMRNKTDEEVSDFFFYLKEREVLYSESAALFQFVPLVRQSLTSHSPAICAAAHSAMNAFMLTSSACFNEYRLLFLESLRTGASAVRNNAIVALHDMIVFYNTEINPGILFDYLDDSEVNRNAALVIYSLLQKNVIRIKGFSERLAAHLFSEDIGLIVRSIIKCISTNNNALSVVVYETFMSSLGCETLEFLCGFVSPTIQESLFLKCLTSGMPAERVRCMFSKFTISEKFIAEHSFRNEMKVLLSGE